MKEILFIGDCGNFKETSNGVYAKNIQLLRRLNELFTSIKYVNTNNWKKNPFVLFHVIQNIWLYRNCNIIISLNTMSAYKLLKVVHLLLPSVRITYFVIGGILPDFISHKEKGQRKCYSNVKWFLVESKKMKEDMESLGYNNVLYVPNFKKITYIPSKTRRIIKPFKFVFLSRIIPEKGCNLIIEATKQLNSEIGKEHFIVHFFGKIADNYRSQFLNAINGVSNIEYKGFLNLAETPNYDVLATYSGMLFPTYWKGEGFPGILIDAMIAGIPVIASDWGYNKEIIDNGSTGIIIKGKDAKVLAHAMASFIDNIPTVEDMAEHCKSKALDYDTDKVIDNKLFDTILK